MVLLGEEAYARGLPLDYFAFPTVGLPDYRPIAPPIKPAVAYAVARQESHFNQKVVSPAHAMGLMQVTPEAAIDTARRFKATYDRARLMSDPVYNMQMGAAELANLFMGYNGSYILTFAGYNAGRGRVRQWIAAYGDPRDPGVDPIDWVERIPLSETRNYVMRVMENLQVYRARFTGGSRLLIEADLRRGAAEGAALPRPPSSPARRRISPSLRGRIGVRHCEAAHVCPSLRGREAAEAIQGGGAARDGRAAYIAAAPFLDCFARASRGLAMTGNASTSPRARNGGGRRRHDAQRRRLALTDQNLPPRGDAAFRLSCRCAGTRGRARAV